MSLSSKGEVSFFYPILNLCKLDFLNDFRDSQLVDEEAVAPIKPKDFSPTNDTHDDGVTMKKCEFEAPYSKDVIMKEAIQEESWWLRFSCNVSWPPISYSLYFFTHSRGGGGYRQDNGSPWGIFYVNHFYCYFPP